MMVLDKLSTTIQKTQRVSPGRCSAPDPLLKIAETVLVFLLYIESVVQQRDIGQVQCPVDQALVFDTAGKYWS